MSGVNSGVWRGVGRFALLAGALGGLSIPGGELRILHIGGGFAHLPFRGQYTGSLQRGRHSHRLHGVRLPGDSQRFGDGDSEDGGAALGFNKIVQPGFAP